MNMESVPTQELANILLDRLLAYYENELDNGNPTDRSKVFAACLVALKEDLEAIFTIAEPKK